MKLSKFGILATFMFCVGFAYGQTDPIVGGYGKVDVKNAEVVKVAKYAVTAQDGKTKGTIKLLGVRSAKQQVVAGLNYNVCMQVSVKRPGKKPTVRYAQAVVYQNLKQELSLTSWDYRKDKTCLK